MTRRAAITQADVPKRIQRKRSKGWRMPPNTVYVGRPTKWGNPFGRDYSHSPSECVDMFRACVLAPFKYRDVWQQEGGDFSILLGIAGPWLDELRGKNLACWCRLDQPCHADILIELANRPVCEAVE